MIAEDGVLLREGLVQLSGGARIRRRRQLRHRRAARSCSSAVTRPDVAIVDIRLPPTHSDEGLRAALEIRAHHPSVGVLVLSQYVEVGLAMKLLADSAEGVGYLLKNRINNVKDFLGAVRRVADGGSAIDPIIISTLLAKRRSDDPLAALTPREREILVLMAEGRLEPGNRGPAGDHAPRRRKARLHDLRQARPPLDGNGIATRPRRTALPALLTRPRRAHETRENRPPKNKFPGFRYAVAAASVEPCSVRQEEQR